MTIDEQIMIEEAVWEASTHINTAYGLMVSFWEDYISHTNDTSLAYDMEYRRYIVEAKIMAVLNEIVSTKAELDVYMNPKSGPLTAILEAADKKRNIIAELQQPKAS